MGKLDFQIEDIADTVAIESVLLGQRLFAVGRSPFMFVVLTLQT